MFKFNFADKVDSSDDVKIRKAVNWLDAKEIIPSKEFLYRDSENLTVKVIKSSCGLDIKYISSNIIVHYIKKVSREENSVLTAETCHSDLVTGVYEGGLKVWECTSDLVNYISDNNVILSEKRVLDLGCGAGIVGILCYMKEAFVYFQDYNPEVIEYFTIPNVLLNATDNAKLCNYKFYSGDWKSFVSVTKTLFQEDSCKFDVIFTSETIYNVDNYKKLHLIFQQLLKRSGIIYLAAKTYYFAVGGGLRQFEDFIRKENIFDFFTCWKNSEGVLREIICLTFKK